MHKLLSSIFRGIWAIEPSVAESYLPQIMLLLDGKIVFEEHNKIFASVIDPNQTNAWGEKIPFEQLLAKAQPGSTALIPISGPIMKEDYCGAVGTATMASWIKMADATKNISSIILQIDSPGGEVSGTQQFAEAIKAVKKPVLAFVDGMMCSAALWIGSAADEIMCSTANDIVGSIGTMMSFADYRASLEAQGVKLHEIYADKSKDKNGIFKAALAGDYTPLKEQLLNPLNDAFIGAVKTNRAGKFDARTENIFTGKTYMAKDAIKNGLADSIGNFDAALSRVTELAKASSKSTNTNQETMKIKSTWKGIMAAITKGTGIEANEETIITAENAEIMNASLETAARELVDAQEKLTTANAAIATLTTEKGVLDASVVKLQGEKLALEGEKTTLTAEVAKLGKTPAVQTPIPAKTGADLEADKKEANAKVVVTTDAHNEMAKQLFGK